jgi:hypothetical protein
MVLAWTPDGRIATVGDNGHTVRFWRSGEDRAVAEWGVSRWSALLLDR